MKKQVNKVGIVVEYNPFHNGHKYQLDWVFKNIQNAEITIAMSKKYTQRGEIACASFYQRKRIAKKFGVKKVIPLNIEISAQAAHIFARESVLKLAAKGIKYLVFGSETGDASVFVTIATTIKNNLGKYNLLVKKYLKEGGNSFPKATSLALKDLVGYEITMPNDILGLEYVKTIVDFNLDIIPIAIKRTVGFHDENINGGFASATKIRKMLAEGLDVSKYTPMKLTKIPKKRDISLTYDKFSKIVKTLPASEISQFKMISEGMENLFKKQVYLAKNYDEFIANCTSKRYTSSRIKRAYLFTLLKIRK
ncbi:nucleotidyltransferase [Mycoplasma corogypsi]|uniref:nucleotidyltransferase n=1 Tax=Mycoplasma corogypsi TaxID=2106 RepID=UPI003872A739